ncbi:MAG: hypothetical protein OXI58_18735 [Gemmatimonadota bacterium]|nr:hypothetical protein [Gemmatimonadota bacterium]
MGHGSDERMIEVISANTVDYFKLTSIRWPRSLTSRYSLNSTIMNPEGGLMIDRDPLEAFW